MPSSAVIAAVEARLDGAGLAWPRNHLNTLGEIEPPANHATFHMITMWTSTETPSSVGSPGARQIEERGAFHIALFVPAGSGIQAAAAGLDTLKGLFRSWADGPLLNIAFSSDAITSDALDGPWFQASFVVTYSYYFIG